MIGRGSLQRSSIQPVLPMERAQHWVLSYLILNWSAWDTSNIRSLCCEFPFFVLHTYTRLANISIPLEGMSIFLLWFWDITMPFKVILTCWQALTNFLYCSSCQITDWGTFWKQRQFGLVTMTSYVLIIIFILCLYIVKWRYMISFWVVKTVEIHWSMKATSLCLGLRLPIDIKAEIYNCVFYFGYFSALSIKLVTSCLKVTSLSLNWRSFV